MFRSTVEVRSVGSASMCSGKSDAFSRWLGPPRSIVGSELSWPPGFSWLTERGSAPPRKWHDAQACTPSLPTCMSQKRALPSAMATSRFRT